MIGAIQRCLRIKQADRQRLTNISEGQVFPQRRHNPLLDISGSNPIFFKTPVIPVSDFWPGPVEGASFAVGFWEVGDDAGVSNF